MEVKLASSLAVPLGKTLGGTPILVWWTGGRQLLRELVIAVRSFSRDRRFIYATKCEALTKYNMLQ